MDETGQEISCPKCGLSSNSFGVYLGNRKVRCLGCSTIYEVEKGNYFDDQR